MYGIGRIPKDVDPLDEGRAEAEAERLQPSPAKRADKPLLRCPSCGQIGYEGEYPFSTGYADDLCDDCG